MSFSVIESGGKQYCVREGSKILIEKLDASVGSEISFDKVLELSKSGTRVHAIVKEQLKADKIVVFKKKRRQNYRRKRGHRQNMTLVEITQIG